MAPVYLKSVARIEALMCTYFLALLTESLIEREMRLAMVAEGIKSISLYPEGRKCKRPCTRRILDLFGNIQRHELTGLEHEPLMMITDLSAIQRQVLGLLKVPRRSYGQPVNINR